jgi:hypothetical protein
MTDTAATSSQPAQPVPPNDRRRQLVLVKPEGDASLGHIGLVGDTHTILFRAADSGRPS